jgi:hypothetical protein
MIGRKPDFVVDAINNIDSTVDLFKYCDDYTLLDIIAVTKQQDDLGNKCSATDSSRKYEEWRLGWLIGVGVLPGWITPYLLDSLILMK